MKSARAIVFDVDGTLYAAEPLRWRLVLRLMGAHLTRPAKLWRVGRVLGAWRRALEELRREEGPVRLPEEQYQRAGLQEDDAREVVEEWFEQRPLELLRGAARPGLREFLAEARARGVRLAVLSDYPAEAKLEALGVAEFFEVVADAGDAEIRRLKPDPKGLEVVLGRLGVAAGEAVYVGDRADVDGECARRAGVRYRAAPEDFGGWMRIF